jgi:hypothetical protein
MTRGSRSKHSEVSRPFTDKQMERARKFLRHFPERLHRPDVRFWPKADIPSCTAHVRFWG